jgi:serine phosphatase RsbU (regulator of sigma subunit)
MFLVLFIYSFFDYKIPAWIKFINYLVCSIFTLFLFSIFSIKIIKLYSGFGQPIIILAGIPYAISLILAIIKAIKEKKDGSRIIAIGLITLLAAFCSGILIYFNISNMINILPESFLIFVFSITVALSAKFYGINNQLLLMQKNNSDELERKIKERTKDLEDAKKTAEIETGIAWIAQRESQSEKEKTEKLLKEIQKDMLTAQKIQQNILPHNLDQIKKLKFSTLYKPVSSVGGDFYDIEEIKPGLVRAFIADATGHGVQAALITMAIKSEYESVKDLLNSPAQILKFLNDNFSNKYKSLSIYFTAFIIDIDTIYNRITYSSAGHIPQVLINENKVELLTHRGNIIGMIPDVEYDEEAKEFSSGRLFLFTDGIEEEFNEEQEQFGEERVLTILEQEKNKPLKTSIDSLYAAMNKFIGTARVRDDITVIGIEHNG